MKKSHLKILPVVLLTLAIGLSPSFSAGKLGGGKIIELRIEDFLLVVLGLVWLANFLVAGKKKFKKAPLFLPILVWLAVGFFSILTNWLFANLRIDKGFFYFLKEIEFFFLYFYLFYHLKNLKSVKFIVKLWIFLGLINISWVLFQAIAGLRITYDYGPTSFMEPSGGFPSAGFFLILFIFLFNIFLFYYLKLKISGPKKAVLGLAIISLAIGALISGSRTGFLGLCFALFLTFFLYLLREKKFKSFLVVILVISFLFLVFIQFLPKISGIERSFGIERMIFEYTSEEGLTRIYILKKNLETIFSRPLFTILGYGVVGEAHSQYMRVLLERGIIGILVFFFLMFIIIKKALWGFLRRENLFLVGLSAGLFVATLTMLLMSIPNDPFMVVKIAEVYWFFVALTMVILSFEKKEEKYLSLPDRLDKSKLKLYKKL